MTNDRLFTALGQTSQTFGTDKWTFRAQCFYAQSYTYLKSEKKPKQWVTVRLNITYQGQNKTDLPIHWLPSNTEGKGSCFHSRWLSVFAVRNEGWQDSPLYHPSPTHTRTDTHARRFPATSLCISFFSNAQHSYNYLRRSFSPLQEVKTGWQTASGVLLPWGDLNVPLPSFWYCTK